MSSEITAPPTIRYNKVGDAKPEDNVTLILHRTWRSTWPYLLAFFVSCWLALRFSDSPEMLLPFNFQMFGTQYELVLPIFSLLAAVSLARPLFLVYDDEHEISCHHLRSVAGICSLRKKRLEYSYDDLLGVEIDQTLIDRLLNVGQVSAGTAMRGGPEVKMEGLADPKTVGQFVTARIDAARMRSNKNKTAAQSS